MLQSLWGAATLSVLRQNSLHMLDWARDQLFGITRESRRYGTKNSLYTEVILKLKSLWNHLTAVTVLDKVGWKLVDLNIRQIYLYLYLYILF